MSEGEEIFLKLLRQCRQGMGNIMLKELAVIGKDILRDGSMSLLPIFKAAKAYQCILLTPLPRYLYGPVL
jgi:hypothetical protein